jgi:hypothetical protein
MARLESSSSWAKGTSQSTWTSVSPLNACGISHAVRADLLLNAVSAEHQGLTPVILATRETEIRRIEAQSQPRQIVHEALYWIYLTQKRARGMAQVVRVPT